MDNDIQEKIVRLCWRYAGIYFSFCLCGLYVLGSFISKLPIAEIGIVLILFPWLFKGEKILLRAAKKKIGQAASVKSPNLQLIK